MILDFENFFHTISRTFTFSSTDNTALFDLTLAFEFKATSISTSKITKYNKTRFSCRKVKPRNVSSIRKSMFIPRSDNRSPDNQISYNRKGTIVIFIISKLDTTQGHDFEKHNEDQTLSNNTKRKMSLLTVTPWRGPPPYICIYNYKEGFLSATSKLVGRRDSSTDFF